LDEIRLLSHLEALAHSLGIKIRYEPMEDESSVSRGGLCRVRDQYYIIVPSQANMGEKVGTLAKALRRFDLSRIYIKPALRELLEGTDQEET